MMFFVDVPVHGWMARNARCCSRFVFTVKPNIRAARDPQHRPLGTLLDGKLHLHEEWTATRNPGGLRTLRDGAYIF